MANGQPDRELRRYVEERAEYTKTDYLERWETDFAAMEGGDEHAAERILGGYLLTISDGYNSVSYHAAFGMHGDPSWGTVLGSRVDVAGQPVPFLFKVCCQGKHSLLCVTLDEVEGRTRQATAIKRDRALMGAGCRVLNYPDGDALTRPGEIADEVSSALSDLADELLADAGITPPRRRRNAVVPIGRKKTDK